MIIPEYLKKGDVVGIVCPAGFMPVDKVSECVRVLFDWGLKVKVGKTVGSQYNYFSGSDDERLADLQEMMDDPSIKAILCGRGGYGTGRIIDKINFKKFRQQPKWIIGFSDITVLHSHLLSRYKIASVHGPMANAFNDDGYLNEYVRSLHKALIGKKADYTKFNKRATNYKNLWNSQSQFFMPKDKEGNWVAIDPSFDGGKGGRDYYDENNGWTYLWQTQHDIKGLIDLMGGSQAFESRLDQLFRKNLGRSKYEFWNEFPDATGLVGQFSMGNEPSFHIPYLYNYAGAPWKTQKRIRFLLDLWFKDNVFGIPGDEDGGGMTAFVVFSSMGFYPVTPGIPAYTIGSPVFSKVTIALSNGKKFTMKANNCSITNKYIQSAKMNGIKLDSPWFTHKQLIDGGTLELEMGPLPNKQWGAGQSF